MLLLLHSHLSTFLRNSPLYAANPNKSNPSDNPRLIGPNPSNPTPQTSITLRSQFPHRWSWSDGSNSHTFQRLASVFLAAVLCLNSGAGDAHAGEVPATTPACSCEDVTHYYSGVEQLEGAALLRRLGSLVSVHRSLPYKDVWEALKILDAADIDDPENSSEIIEIYSLRAVSKSLAGKLDGWNREHLWPRSYGLMGIHSLTDLHNLRPADVNVNSSRGNKYYGECISESTKCMRPANSEAAPDTETDKERWAPPLQVRGDIARSLMYMAVCYGFHQPSGSPHLQLSDSPNTENSEMGLLSELLKWNELDPPSRAEQVRNDRICRLYQHNRNPFIDHPEYASLIWRHMAPSNAVGSKPPLNVWINELHYDNKGKDQNEFVEIVITLSTDATAVELMLYNGSSGKIYKSLPLRDNKLCTVTDGGSGCLIYTAFVLLQNGPGDGMALVSTRDGDQLEVVLFLSYEGNLRATAGPAKGMESVDISVQETEASSKYDSLGLSGASRGKCHWRKFRGAATPGRPNIGQRKSRKWLFEFYLLTKYACSVPLTEAAATLIISSKSSMASSSSTSRPTSRGEMGSTSSSRSPAMPPRSSSHPPPSARPKP